MNARRPTTALLVASAGCSGLVGTDGQPSETTTAPTTDTTTETPASTSEQLAPGLTSEGVTDALTLADAHLSQLENASFGKVSRVKHPNADDASFRYVWMTAANESNWRMKVDAAGMPLAYGRSNGVFWQYADGEKVLWRLLTSGNGTQGNVTYGVRNVDVQGRGEPIPPEQVFPSGTYERSLVYSLFGNADVTVENASGSTTTVSGTVDEMTIGQQPVTEVEFTATVQADGLVESVDMTYEQDGWLVERMFEFETTNQSSVSKPVWYDTALNRTGAEPAS
ncbi:hypothetical protein [Halobacterium wangiae]|uniref:hypothetical protein n=1 Tax=Halobacterium wangiae TaxID=2902623 RepID=UPI001E367C78|nr:hypothetical protein [Halobacterium wangiae]